MIPVEQARLFARRLRDVSASAVAYAELPMAQHSFDMLASTRSVLTAEAVARFLEVVYGDSARDLGRSGTRSQR
jgi:acetyl esterase/lipase